jgi:hypothetical protein
MNPVVAFLWGIIAGFLLAILQDVMLFHKQRRDREIASELARLQKESALSLENMETWSGVK